MDWLLVVYFVDLVMNCVTFYGVIKGNLTIVKLVVAYTVGLIFFSIAFGMIGFGIIWFIFLCVHWRQLSAIAREHDEEKQMLTVNTSLVQSLRRKFVEKRVA